jgi:hypothetical protein
MMSMTRAALRLAVHRLTSSFISLLIRDCSIIITEQKFSGALQGLMLPNGLEIGALVPMLPWVGVVLQIALIPWWARM